MRYRQGFPQAQKRGQAQSVMDERCKSLWFDKAGFHLPRIPVERRWGLEKRKGNKQGK